MNRNRLALWTVIFGLLLAAGVLSAQGERIVVPLSDPGRPAELHVSVMTGSIAVSAWDGNEIVVVATLAEEDHEVEHRDGMMRIPNSSVGLTIEERNNRVSVDADWSANRSQLEIQVPARTSLKLGTVNGGDIEVVGVTGTHELENVNGAISALDVSGSVVAATTNGDVKVVFSALDADTPMSFSTWNGDIDLTMPASTRARLHLNSGRGDIFTDLDVALEPLEAKVSREEGKGGYRVRIEKEVVGTINGGGPDFRMKTFNGSIYVRKAGG